MLKPFVRKFSTFNTKLMNKMLDTNNLNTRSSLKKLFKNPKYIPKYNLSLDEERQIAYDRIKMVCEKNLVSVRDFEKNPRNIFTAHEILGMCDGSLCTKFTVQFNLFGGTLFKLGTEKHHEICDEIDNFDTVGCFGLTELGYGNNAVEMETTATYDDKNEEFIINTPTTKAQKYWITNGAVHAHKCIVFARLIMPNGVNEGLHGFIVDIRDENLNVKKNVKIWDLGYKIGLNGIDNAALWFDNVRIPKDNLLDSTAKIENNKYVSSIEDNSERKRKRFIVLADQLLSGRICIASMCLGSTKMVLDTTIKYAHSRLAVGKKGYSDMAIMNYQLQKNALIPLIAKTYAYNFFLNYVQEKYENQNEENYDEVVRLSCIVKPLITWHTENTATICRERCGGQGFLSANRFGEAIAGSHAGITAEGDNSVIQQKVSKELLSLVKKNDVIKNYFISNLPNLIKMLYYKIIQKNKFKSLEWYQNIFKLREQIILCNLAYKLNKNKENLFENWMFNQSDNIQNLANAYATNLVIETFIKNINYADESLKNTLIQLLEVYAITEINNNIGFFLDENIILKRQKKLLENELIKNNTLLSKKSLDLVRSFDIPNWMNHAPISNDWIEYNNYENNGEINNDKYKNI